MALDMKQVRSVFGVAWLPVVVASLCCLSPIILVLTGLGSVALATSLADTLYGEYKWVFRIAGLSALGVALVIYLRREKNICTLDEAKKRRNEVINAVALTLLAGVLGYLFFLYVVVHYIGVFLAIWE
jgi:hypothetical protein